MIYIAKVVAWDPIEIEGLPEEITGSVKLKFPKLRIDVLVRELEDPTLGLLATMMPELRASVEVPSFGLDFEGIQGLSRDDFVAMLRRDGAEDKLRKMYELAEREYAAGIREILTGDAGRAVITAKLIEELCEEAE